MRKYAFIPLFLVVFCHEALAQGVGGSRTEARMSWEKTFIYRLAHVVLEVTIKTTDKNLIDAWPDSYGSDFEKIAMIVENLITDEHQRSLGSARIDIVATLNHPTNWNHSTIDWDVMIRFENGVHRKFHLGGVQQASSSDMMRAIEHFCEDDGQILTVEKLRAEIENYRDFLIFVSSTVSEDSPAYSGLLDYVQRAKILLDERAPWFPVPFMTRKVKWVERQREKFKKLKGNVEELFRVSSIGSLHELTREYRHYPALVFATETYSEQILDRIGEALEGTDSFYYPLLAQTIKAGDGAIYLKFLDLVPAPNARFARIIIEVKVFDYRKNRIYPIVTDRLEIPLNLERPIWSLNELFQDRTWVSQFVAVFDEALGRLLRDAQLLQLPASAHPATLPEAHARGALPAPVACGGVLEGHAHADAVSSAIKK